MVGTPVTYHHSDGSDRPAVISAEEGKGKDKATSIIVHAVPSNYEVANVHEGKNAGNFEFIK